MHNSWMRHDLAWLSQRAVANAQYLGPAPLPSEEAMGALKQWQADDLPLIVTRQVERTPGQQQLADPHVRLGLAEPLAMGKRRMAFLVLRADVLRNEQGPTLAQALGHLPIAWQFKVGQLLSTCQQWGIECRLFGSAALQVVSGLGFLHADSDLDLIATPSDWQGAMALCAALHELSLSAPGFKVDCEIRNPHGQDVHWRELRQNEHKVLAKSITQVQLMGLAEFKHAFVSQQRGAA